jgi:hypothetical protein
MSVGKEEFRIAAPSGAEGKSGQAAGAFDGFCCRRGTKARAKR